MPIAESVYRTWYGTRGQRFEGFRATTKAKCAKFNAKCAEKISSESSKFEVVLEKADSLRE